ncbi:hypothetical protein [Bradyrhizobium sp. BR 10289]|uniref:hypothetical protein n=1 Tax=Bradyrhizobium sp. BR 10289 TaxID=2749993 RepID=UPI001C64ECA5|nr:hypothetical protein [Bradyrhizobium sp. BR 10289]MBW7973250.1 hypothetical protein [Bradyrhizobium sp. BR 10289]
MQALVLEPGHSRVRPTVMLEALLSAIVEILLNTAGSIIARIFGVDTVIEIATVIIGLGLIATGLTAHFWGH